MSMKTKGEASMDIIYSIHGYDLKIRFLWLALVSPYNILKPANCLSRKRPQSVCRVPVYVANDFSLTTVSV